jgi:hypothetical protein
VRRTTGFPTRSLAPGHALGSRDADSAQTRDGIKRGAVRAQTSAEFGVEKLADRAPLVVLRGNDASLGVPSTNLATLTN